MAGNILLCPVKFVSVSKRVVIQTAHRHIEPVLACNTWLTPVTSAARMSGWLRCLRGCFRLDMCQSAVQSDFDTCPETSSNFLEHDASKL